MSEESEQLPDVSGIQYQNMMIDYRAQQIQDEAAPRDSSLPMPDIENPQVVKPSGLDLPANNQDLHQTIENLQREIETLRAEAYHPSSLANPFFFKCTATSGTAIAFKEQAVMNGAFQDFNTPRIGVLSASGIYGLPISSSSYVSSGQTGLMIQTVDPAISKIAYRYVSVSGNSISFLVTSDSDQIGKYNAKSIKNANAIDYGTINATEDLIFWNGAEDGTGPHNMLLIDPNTSAFGVMGSGTIAGIDPDTGKRIVNGWMGFVNCTDDDTPSGSDGSL